MTDNRPASKPSATYKWLLSIGFIIASVIYVMWQNTTTAAETNQTATVTLPVSSSPTNNETASSSVTSPPPPVKSPPQNNPYSSGSGTAPTPKKAFVDGSFTGNAIDAFYGIVQVKAVIQNGKLTDVQFLQYPNDRETSRYISSQAMPLLKEEAIQVQSAQVDGVSGATQTSEAFIQSLASALKEAKA